MKKTGSNINTIKNDNNSLILNSLRSKTLSRIEISKLTGLSKSAVTTITKQMITQGYLTEIGTESTNLGRHPILLDIVNGHRYAMGISLHRKEIAVCITDIKFECVDVKRKPISEFGSPEAAADWAFNSGLKIMDENCIDRNKCLGIGIAAPGPLNDKSGKIFNPPNFPLIHNFNIIEYITSKSDYPVMLNNAPVLMALYESKKHLPAIKNYSFIIVDNGVGSAIMQNGSIYRGDAGLAGEIGHTSIDLDGEQCICGNKGCLEFYITKNAIKERFNLKSYSKMIDSAYDGDLHAKKIVDYIAVRLASAIINMINLLDLEAVIISGELNYRHELLFDKIQNYINSRSIVAKSHPIRLMPSLIKTENISFSTAMVLEHYFDQPE